MACPVTYDHTALRERTPRAVHTHEQALMQQLHGTKAHARRMQAVVRRLSPMVQRVAKLPTQKPPQEAPQPTHLLHHGLPMNERGDAAALDHTQKEPAAALTFDDARGPNVPCIT